MARRRANKQFGGSSVAPAYSGTGTYVPFTGGIRTTPTPTTNALSSGAAPPPRIDTYIPPVPPNPLYVPPSYTQNDNGRLRIVLRSNQVASYTQDGINVGYGNSVEVNFNPSTRFGSSRTYRAEVNGKQSSKYFVVSVAKKYDGLYRSQIDYGIAPIPPFNGSLLSGIYDTRGVGVENKYIPGAYDYNLNFNYSNNTGNYITRNDYLYSEVISIQEFNILDGGGFVPGPTRTINNTNGIVDLEFSFENKTGTNNSSIPADDVLVDYEISFTSNFKNELGNYLNLTYQIIDSNNNIIQTDSVKLADSNTDNKKIAKSILTNGSVNIEIKEIGTLPDGYSYFDFYYTDKNNAQKNPENFAAWKKTNKSFKITGKELLSGIAVSVLFEKIIDTIRPTVKLAGKLKDFSVKDSDPETEANIAFIATNATYVDVYISENKPIRVPAASGIIKLLFKKHFGGIYGSKKIYLVPILDTRKYKTVSAPTQPSESDDFEYGLTDPASDEYQRQRVEIAQGKRTEIDWNLINSVEKTAKDEAERAGVPFLTNPGSLLNTLARTNPTANQNVFTQLGRSRDQIGRFPSRRPVPAPVAEPKLELIEGELTIGERVPVILKFIAVNDFPSITQITAPTEIDIPSFSDLSIDYEVTYNTFAATSVDVFLLAKNKTKINIFKNLPPNGVFKINLRELAKKFSQWNGNTNVTLIFKPYNRGGVTVLEGNEYEIVTNVTYPKIKLDEDIIKKAVYDVFDQKLTFTDLPKEEKYLTHLANFGNDEQIIISSWEEDSWTLSKKSISDVGIEFVKPQDAIQTIILKLYSPLPANVIENSTFWITKLMSNPLIETVILNEQDDIKCPPIKGPNFNIDVDYISGESIGYESLDTLILSSSLSSSAQLVSTYLSKSIIPTDDLNIEYYSGSTYLWDNFVHFSSAKERVDNFVYKVQLIESYDNLINKNISLSNDYNESVSAKQELERQTLKKNQLINVFDGFEKFLYQSSSLSWPYINSTQRYASTSSTVMTWYENIINLADDFDNQNPNFLKNNIPAYIQNNDENQNYLLFFSMVGQHFDNIYYHTKSIEKSRGLGYKSKDGMSDRLLFDALKSFGWDARNLAVDAKLWEYVLGLDSDGNQKFETPAKQRTYEVWRRIINNLPYLLKHKGSRKGIYALLSCYGIPSSNLSIFEFGGPEVTDTTKSKLIIDNLTNALKFTIGSYIEFQWKNTEKNRKPDTIEFFVKPTQSGVYQIVSGSNWGIKLSGSVGSEYGKVIFNYSGSNSVTSSLLPIFNKSFFGVEVSRITGSISHSFELNIKQSDKERVIFQESKLISASITDSNWDSGDKITLGNDFIGSVDEFRLWSTPLDKERFYEHVSFPEMINGNHISSSTDDLFFRLDFEYPKNLYQYTSLPNVDTNMYFENGLDRNAYEKGSTAPLYSLNISASFSASAFGFTNITDYPYQFELIDRTVVLEVPDFGASRYSTNKIRFESQYTMRGDEISGSVGVDLSVKSRATKRSFDQAPADSNRVGLFFSPTKELNIDVAKSLGGINLDNYIGDPSDRYKPNYNKLDSLRKYYFKRFDNRDIYAYINLIKLYEKSMFEDIKKMLPARVKATTGLLIEPHILERSKYEHKKPISDSYQKESNIHLSDNIEFHANNTQFETIIDASFTDYLISDSYQYDTIIQSSSVNNIIADSYQYNSLIDTNEVLTQVSDYYQKEVVIDSGLAEATVQSVVEDNLLLIGQTDYESVGFGIYAQNGYAIRTYYDKDKNLIKERIKVDLVTEQKERRVEKFNVVVNGKGDPRAGMYTDLETYYETKLNIQPYSGSKVINAGTGSIVSVKQANGYLPTHYRNTSDLTRGLENSFFRGSKNTSATTLDGTPPIETFATNPNTLRVNKAGRDSSEPILEVE